MENIKAKDFWSKLCLELNYVFYSGLPIDNFKSIFKNMDPEKMHYIPTVDEIVATGIVSGSFLAGVKGAVLMSSGGFDILSSQLEKFNLFYGLPVLFIVENEYNPMNLKQFNLKKEGLHILEEMDHYLINYSKPCVLIVDGEELL